MWFQCRDLFGSSVNLPINFAPTVRRKIMKRNRYYILLSRQRVLNGFAINSTLAFWQSRTHILRQETRPASEAESIEIKTFCEGRKTRVVVTSRSQTKSPASDVRKELKIQDASGCTWQALIMWWMTSSAEFECTYVSAHLFFGGWGRATPTKRWGSYLRVTDKRKMLI